MKAVVIRAYGGPEVLKCDERPDRIDQGRDRRSAVDQGTIQIEDDGFDIHEAHSQVTAFPRRE